MNVRYLFQNDKYEENMFMLGSFKNRATVVKFKKVDASIQWMVSVKNERGVQQNKNST